MNTARPALAALVDAWRRPPALGLWPQAVAGVRDWQHALAEAAPPRLTIDAWPREPDVAPLLAPMADSPLADWRESAAEGAASPADRHATRRLDAPRSGALAPPVGPAPLHRSPATRATAARLRAGSDDAAAPSSAPAALATPSAGAARIAGLLARHASLAHEAAPLPAAPKAVPGSGTARPEPGATAVRNNVIALPRRRALREPAAAGETTALDRWSQVLAQDAPRTPQIAALLARGEPLAAEPAQRLPSAAATTATRSFPDWPAAASAGPTRRLDAAASPVPTPAHLAVPDLASNVMPTVAAVPPALEPGPGVLAGLQAALARIEQQLVSPPPPAEAPQWLDDDEHLAERLHDILRRQARRHGIDAP